jgi:hypothetical protein
MVRTQIQLTEEQSSRLREAARRSGLSAAEIIRQSVDRFLAQGAGGPIGSTTRLSALEVSGRFHSGLSDVAARHDVYLDEAYRPPAAP